MKSGGHRSTAKRESAASTVGRLPFLHRPGAHVLPRFRPWPRVPGVRKRLEAVPPEVRGARAEAGLHLAELLVLQLLEGSARLRVAEDRGHRAPAWGELRTVLISILTQKNSKIKKFQQISEDLRKSQTI